MPNLEVFVDGGGNSAIGVNWYLSKFKKFHKIFVFEPNPIFYSSYDGEKMNLIKKAVWVEDTTLPFYLSRDIKQAASSLIADNFCRVGKDFIPNFHRESINVECVDFSKWLKDNIKPNYNLTLKLDIEGAEYAVLKKMMKDKTIGMVKDLYVEFHWRHMSMAIEEHNLFLNELKANGVVPKYWD